MSRNRLTLMQLVAVVPRLPPHGTAQFPQCLHQTPHILAPRARFGQLEPRLHVAEQRAQLPGRQGIRRLFDFAERAHGRNSSTDEGPSKTRLRRETEFDYAGFRTLDSVVRAEAVFGLKRFTIITDDFREPRSVFLAQSRGLDVVGFPSDPVPWIWSKKARARELLSRVCACLDVYVLHTNPMYFGPRVVIQVAAAR